ncbi:MAG: Tfp pilus assembly protein PilF [Candidatus Krumholzibacteriia bacterium]
MGDFDMPTISLGQGRTGRVLPLMVMVLVLGVVCTSASFAASVASRGDGRALIAEHPTDPHSYITFAEYLQKEGKWGQAEQVLELGRNKADSSAELLVALGTVHEHQNQLEKAEAVTRAALALDPKSVFAHIRMGEIYLQLGWPKSGLESFETAHGLAPEMALPKVRIVGAMVEQDLLTEAEDECLKFISSDVENADLWLALGQVFESQNKLQAAFTTYGQVLTLGTRQAEAYARQGRLFCRFGQYDAGKAACAQSLAIDDQNILAHAYMGIACSNLGEGDSAREHAKIAEAGGMNMNAVWDKLMQ